MIQNDILQLENVTITNYLENKKNGEILNEIVSGLTSENKKISSTFFYDKLGSELFEKITQLKEYYPTRTEKSILKKIAPNIFSNLKNADIIELGSGDCSKISILLDAIPKENLETITYVPVDVSISAVEKSTNILTDNFPELNIDAIVADFLEQFEYLNRENEKIICFLGSTIGNLNPIQAKKFIDGIASKMHKKDKFLLGTDMVKDTRVLEKAYNDELGITAAFNKNILSNLNKISGTNFDINEFEHHAFFNQIKSRIEMHLVAQNDTKIKFPSEGNQSIEIKQGESIHTENSYKFNEEMIFNFTLNNNLELINIFTDDNAYFSLCLFSKI